MDLGTNRFDYRIVSAMCALSGLALVGFSLSHISNSNYPLFLLIGGFALLLIGFAWVSWRRRGTSERLTYSIIAGANVVTLVSLYDLQGLGIYWIYPVAVVNFAFLQPREGLIGNIAFGSVAFLLTTTWAPTEEIARIGLTYFILMSFGFFFSYYLTEQQNELRRLARLDPLTGIGNRRALEQELAESIVAKQRYNRSASLLVMDLDHFKTINDEVGHAGGDQVLCCLAQMLRNRLRQTDHIFRYGGEEFVIVTPHTSLEEATILAEQIRGQVAALRFDGQRTVTVSIGVAELEPGETAGEWLERGDQALYRAKAEGRNRAIGLARGDETCHPQAGGDDSRLRAPLPESNS